MMNRDPWLAAVGLVASIGLGGCAASAARERPNGAAVHAAVPAAPAADAPAAAPPSAAAVEPIRQRAAKLIAAHCTSCHDETNRLDLRVPPPASDRATWQKIASMVKSGRMPPTSADTPFPLDHEARQKLAGAAATIAGSDRRARARPVIHASMTWVGIVHEVADPFLGGAEVDRIVLQYRGGIGGLRDDVDPSPTPMAMLMPLGQVNMDRISYDVCRRMIDADARAADGARRILPGTTERAPHEAVAAALHRRIYDEQPPASELANEAALVRNVQAKSGSLADAAVTLCTTELSGPRVMIVAADGEESP